MQSLANRQQEEVEVETRSMAPRSRAHLHFYLSYFASIGLAAAVLPSQGTAIIVASAVGVFCVPAQSAATLPRVPWGLLVFIGCLFASAAIADSTGASILAVLEVIAVSFSAWVVVANFSFAQFQRLLLSATRWLLLVSIGAALAVPAIGREVGNYQQGALQGVAQHRNILAFALFVGICFSNPRFHVYRRRATNWANYLFLFGGLLATSSATGLALALGVGCLQYVFLQNGKYGVRRRRYLVGLSVVAFPLLAIFASPLVPRIIELSGRDLTFTGRTGIWEQVVLKIQSQPYLGYGWGASWEGSAGKDIIGRIGFHIDHAHNGYLDLLFQVGVAGLLAFAVFYAGLLRETGRHGSGATAQMMAILWTFLLALAAYNFTETRFLRPLGWFLICVVAFYVCGDRISRRAGSRSMSEVRS